MQLDNHTAFEAGIQLADLGRSEFAVGVTIKATYLLAPSNKLTVSLTPEPLIAEVETTPYGVFHSELYFKKHGVDVCVLGSVHRRQPIKIADVRLCVGQRRWRLLVFGDRRWRAGSNGLRASAPQPFTTMPLGYSHTYGGVAKVNGQQIPHPDNPSGRGYYRDASQAVGQLVQNIEDPSQPRVRCWTAGGHVAGWGPYPNFWGLRGPPNLGFDSPPTAVTTIHPGFFSHCHPDLSVDELPPGTPVHISGLTETPTSFYVPPPSARVYVRLGHQSFEAPAPIDGMFIWPNENKIVFTQRARFKYRFETDQVRGVVVRPYEAERRPLACLG